jgi:signal transduction histidine kinase
MNLYSRKQSWKILLLFFALIILSVSLWFSSHIIEQIRQDERLRIHIWSEAVSSTVNQFYVTSKLFDRLREEERRKVRLWAKAMQELGKEQSDYTFALEIVEETQNIPAILTDADGNYSFSNNLDFTEEQIKKNVKLENPDRDETWYRLESKKRFEDSIRLYISVWERNNMPITLYFRNKPIYKVYYRESKEIEVLERRKDSLNYAFRKELVKNQALVPVIFTDSSRQQVIETNFDSTEINAPGKLQTLVEELSAQNPPIKVRLNDREFGYIFYRDSDVLTLLRYFPLIQLVIVSIFILIGYLIFSTFRRAEQNQIWVGMAKETAHQLGTPLSSLLAWLEILREQGVDQLSIDEMNKDIQRLQTVTERFSKIGSEGKLENINLTYIINKSLSYLRHRISKNVTLEFIEAEEEILAKINPPLFEWVIENLVKNAVDAMEGHGHIRIETSLKNKEVIIDISDTGKGIPSGKFKTIFEPGYTTKKRGWGLGLTLVKRIVEYYHKGEIYVLQSEVDKGTTFRIIIHSAEEAK